jgi:dipeptidyl aminopeptidase/acylaminoacyl peptidase
VIAPLQRWLRRLTGPLGRRVLLALAVVAAWVWWVWGPLAPVRSWGVSSDVARPVGFSRDGTTAITVSGLQQSAGPVRLWDVATGRERLKVLDADAPWPIPFLAPDNSWLLTLDAKNGLVLWDTATGKVRATLWPPEDLGRTWDTRAVAISPDGRVIAREQLDHRAVRLWESATGRLLAILDGACQPLVFTPDGQAVATATQGTDAKLWDVQTGRERFTFAGHPSQVGAIAVSPDGRRLATGLLQRKFLYQQPAPLTAVKLWDAGTGQSVATIAVEQQEVAVGLTFSPDNGWLVIRSEPIQGLSNSGLIWDITTDPPTNRDDLIATTGPALAAGRQLNSASGLTFVPGDTRWLVDNIADHTMTVREPRAPSPEVILRLSRGGWLYSDATFIRDNRTMAVASRFKASTAVQHLREWARRFASREILPDSVGLQVFDLTTGRERMSLPRTPYGYGIAGFAPDGESLWTFRIVSLAAGAPLVFEQWAAASPWPPTWLLAVTAVGVLLAAADWRRERRRRGQRRLTRAAL